MRLLYENLRGDEDVYVNSHANGLQYSRMVLFQSTLPVRGATANGGRIAIGDKFQSTLPVRGATEACSILPPGKQISIHAPRAGSDEGTSWCRSTGINFNPRSPCGERPMLPHGAWGTWLFQSTLPVRGATALFSVLRSIF